MSRGPTGSTEWQRLVRAVEAGAGAEWGLEERHLRRARNIEIGASGEVTFEVERHPSLFGQQTVGRPSAAFARLLMTYRFHPVDGLHELGDPTDLGNEINYEMVASDCVPLLLEADDLSFVDRAKNETEARAAAAEYASRIDWLIGFDQRLTGVEREGVISSCRSLTVEMLLERWLEEHE